MRIAILGTRGIPARYGGFETFAEELSVRLVARGHEVVVYGRRALGDSRDGWQSYRGVAVRILPTILHKYLETVVHSLLSFLDCWIHRYDCILLCNAANSPWAWIGRLRGVPIAINVDGIERKRSKWNALGRAWYWLGEHCSVWFGNVIVADAEVIASYYRERYGVTPAVITYGATAKWQQPGPTLAKFNLETKKYVLYVSRFEPENNPLGVVQAFANVDTDLRLVMVGDAPYAHDYIAQVKAAADERVVFTGYQFGEAYQELRSHALIAIQATEVGGTHPALVEAMAYGNCVLANDVPEHREVVGEAGVYYARNDFAALANKLQMLLAQPERIQALGEQAKARAAERYSWDLITDQYGRLICELMQLSGKSKIG